MSDAMSYLVSQVAKMKAAVDAIASWRWATVTSVDPLRVTPDGDTSPLPEAPDTLVGGLMVGDRVRLVIVARRALVLGRAGGGLRVCTDFTTAAGWDATKLHVVRDGDLVAVYGCFKQSSGNITAPATYAGAFTLPEGFRPTTTVEVPAFGAASNTVGYAGWAWIDTSGRLTFGVTGSGPVNRVVFNMTYQAA